VAGSQPEWPLVVRGSLGGSIACRVASTGAWRTALASSVVESEGIGQLHVDPVAVNAALGEMEASGSRESADAEGR
jgi:hypothetical protein